MNIIGQINRHDDENSDLDDYGGTMMMRVPNRANKLYDASIR